MKTTHSGLPITWINRPPLKGLDLSKCCLRPNALDILSKSSRIGQTLFYPTGEICKQSS